ncbi:MAG: PCMD domain-containing protein [Mucinivorans sp.]
MRRFFALLTLALPLAMMGCIENDIPFPVIKGDVTEIKFEGQKEVKIDATKRVITLALNDTVDLRAVHITKMKISEESRSSIAEGSAIDFSQGSGSYAVSSKPYKFTVSTYQDYDWEIVCTQEIPYKFVVKDGIDNNVDVRNKAMIVSVPEGTNLYGIQVEKFCLGPAGAKYEPDPAEVTVFNGPVKFRVSYFGVEEMWTIHVQYSKENVITGAVAPWAMFATVEGKVQSGSALEAGFEYRKASETEWKYTKASKDNGKIWATLTPLSPNTDYVFRARLGEESAKEIPFHTAATVMVENMGFEDWALKGKAWYPNPSPTNSFWASGNEGVTAPIAGGKDSNTAPTDDAKVGKKAALIKTIVAPVVGLAAGSIFTGDFVLTPTAPLTSPKFSRPYQGRPTQLKFWYKYDPKPVNVTGSSSVPEVVNKGDIDRCIVYIYLGDWDDILLSSQLKKDKTPGVIAYGEFVTDKAVSTYTQQTIDIQYYDTSRPVTKMIIVGTSSIYGDYYTGGEGSTLWLDELEFGWLPPSAAKAGVLKRR